MIDAAVFDVVVEAETSRTVKVLASAFSHFGTSEWSFLPEAPAANLTAIDWTSLNRSATGQGFGGISGAFPLVGDMADFLVGSLSGVTQ